MSERNVSRETFWFVKKEKYGMFREMRRNRQKMDAAACVCLLNNGTSGVLAVNGEGGYPYTIPLNYIYEDGKLYFHGAKSGHKIDAILKDAKVSFCVIGMEQNVPEKFTVYFKSVVVFGKAVIVKDDTERREAIRRLADRFSPDESNERRDAEITREWKSLTVIRVDIEYMSGKQAIELVKEREG